MKDTIIVELDLPDVILSKFIQEADNRGLSVDELTEVVVIDYIEGNR